jgi:hypothetical protein
LTVTSTVIANTTSNIAKNSAYYGGLAQRRLAVVCRSDENRDTAEYLSTVSLFFQWVISQLKGQLPNKSQQ